MPDQAITPPASRSPKVHADWLAQTPTDEDFLAVAFDYLDVHYLDYANWLESRGNLGALPEDPRDTQARAIRLAEAWKELGFTRGDLKNFMDMSPHDQRVLASNYAMGRARQGFGGPLADWERALYYHTRDR